MSMQDLKACRDYVLNLQDEKNLHQVKHEATKKELALVKDELERDTKRNKELQEETTRLLLSLSRAQKQQQEYDQQLQEVRAALKRKSEDLEILKTKLSDEESKYLARYKKLLSEVECIESAESQSVIDHIDCNKNADSAAPIENSENCDQPNQQNSDTKNADSRKEAEKEGSKASNLNDTQDTELAVDPKIQEAINVLQGQMQEAYDRTMSAISEPLKRLISGMVQGFENPALREQYREFYDECIYPENGGGILGELYHIMNALQFDPTGTGTTSYAEGDANLDEELALEVQSKSGLAVTGDDLEYSSGEK